MWNYERVDLGGLISWLNFWIPTLLRCISHLSHWVSLSKSAELGPSQRRVAGVVTSLPRRSQQPTYPRRCYSVVAGWRGFFPIHPMIHHGFWVFKGWTGGWSTSKSLGNLPLIPVKPGSFLFCLDFCQALIPKHMRVNARKDETFMRWDGKTHI